MKFNKIVEEIDFFKVVSNIKSLHIQGATAICKEGAKAFANYVFNGTNIKKDAEYAKKKLLLARPTEPMLKNIINKIILNSKTKEDYIKVAEELIKLKDESAKIIAKKGADLIKDGMNIFTHCHSSSVINVLTEAKKQGKKFNVVCFETRPLFQGRVTASELVKAGIRTTLTIDSAMTESFEIFPPDMIFVGCDAITKTFVVNKIGTDTLAHIAKVNNVPFYVCGETSKYTDNVIIEQRPSDEVWETRPKKLNIYNPAFDTIANRLITGFITEKGILRRVKGV